MHEPSACSRCDDSRRLNLGGRTHIVRSPAVDRKGDAKCARLDGPPVQSDPAWDLGSRNHLLSPDELKLRTSLCAWNAEGYALPGAASVQSEHCPSAG